MKRIFVCEFITCGGLRYMEETASLFDDAELMYQSLLSDLRKIDDLEIITCRDDRLSSIPESGFNIGKSDDVWQIWKSCMDAADIAWIVAPETKGILLKLNRLAISCGCELIGCKENAVEITSSKLLTNQRLLESGIPAVKSSRLEPKLLPSESGWVVKQDDGAGGEECFVFTEAGEYQRWEKNINNKAGYIQQPYVDGISASLSVLYTNEEVVLLSCNKQHTTRDNNGFVNKGITLNYFNKHKQDFRKIANEIAIAIKGLYGYVGIDLLITKEGPVVLEINPRLTTSYSGLSELLNKNIAEMIINKLSDESSMCADNNIHTSSRYGEVR
jgi:tyramine---L-glutamate ligase